MEFTKTFVLPITLEDAWLSILETAGFVAHIPGVAVDEIRGADVLGLFQIRQGPVPVVYEGRITVGEKDTDRNRIVLYAAGHDLRDGATASARITTGLRTALGRTTMSFTASLKSDTRAVAAAGVLVDLGEQILDEFAVNLVNALSVSQTRPPPGPAQRPPLAGSMPEQEAHGPVDPHNLIRAVWLYMLRRLNPVLAALASLAGMAVLRRMVHRARRRR